MKIAFFQNFVRDPVRMGSIVPSSRYLGEKIRQVADELNPGPKTVVVLGIGTGAIARAFCDQDLHGYDLNGDLLKIARLNVPQAKLMKADVLSPEFTLPPLGGGRRIAIVSCIPVLNLPAARKRQFEANVQRMVEHPDAFCFIQYSYRSSEPLSLPALSYRKKWVLRNVPPATVHCWYKSPSKS